MRAIADKHNHGKNEGDYSDIKVLKRYIDDLMVSMRKFYGIATKYIKHYMYWIAIFTVKLEYNLGILVNKLSKESSYISGRKLKFVEAI